MFVDMPGVQPDALDIRFQNRELSIHGSVQPRHEGEYLGREYGVGDFYRAFAIQEGIDGETINAELKNGVLTIHVPKTQAVRPRRIQVKAI